MNKLLDDISKLQLQITNKKNLEIINTELKTLPREYSKINKNTFNEFYNFENKYEEKKLSNIDIIFPEDSLGIQDMHRVDAINTEVDRIHTNIIKRNDIYSKALKDSNINEIHSKLTESRESSAFNLIDMIKLYKHIDFKISNDNFDDEFCINNGNQEYNSFIRYSYINNEVDTLKNIKKYNNELNAIFYRSLEVIKHYDIEKLIIDPELSNIDEILKTNLRLTDDFIESLSKNSFILSKNSFILSYELTPELFLNLDQHMIINYDLLVDKINIINDPRKLKNLLERINMSAEYLVDIKSLLDEKKIYCNSSPDLLYLSSELIPKIDTAIKAIKAINKINKENISQYIIFILSIEKEYELIIKTIKEFNHKIVENNKNYEELYKKFEGFNKYIVSFPAKITEINNKMLSLNTQSNNFDKMQLLKDSIIIYNNFLDKQQKKPGQVYNYTTHKIDLSQYGGSVNEFNDYFNKLVDISINVNKNDDISEHKIRFNNLLFYSHVLYIVNYTNKERIITSHINRVDVKKYLNIIENILKSIKNKSDKNMKNYYFFKYHYFNLKIVYSFLNKLDKLWTFPKSNKCNEKIIKLYNTENEMNNNIYFNLLDIKYTPSMKKAIFIFFGMKVILDSIDNYT